MLHIKKYNQFINESFQEDNKKWFDLTNTFNIVFDNLKENSIVISEVTYGISSIKYKNTMFFKNQITNLYHPINRMKFYIKFFWDKVDFTNFEEAFEKDLEIIQNNIKYFGFDLDISHIDINDPIHDEPFIGQIYYFKITKNDNQFINESFQEDNNKKWFDLADEISIPLQSMKEEGIKYTLYYGSIDSKDKLILNTKKNNIYGQVFGIKIDIYDSDEYVYQKIQQDLNLIKQIVEYNGHHIMYDKAKLRSDGIFKSKILIT